VAGCTVINDALMIKFGTCKGCGVMTLGTVLRRKNGYVV